LYAYGAPQSTDELPDYFLHLLKGETVPDAVVASLGERFRRFGSVDPLSSQTVRIAKGLEKVLSNRMGEEIRAYNAYKHTPPFVKDTLEQMLSEGVTKIAVLTIYPIFSSAERATLHQEIERSLEGKRQVELIYIEDWYTAPEIIEVYVERVRRAFRWIPSHIRPNTYVLYTVHSQRINPAGNKVYVQQHEEMASRISKQAGISNWKAVYRSAGDLGEWLTPDVKDEMRRLAAIGAKGFVTCELMTLVADLESFYEIGEDTQRVAEELQAEFVRAEFPGDSFDAVVALAAIVEKQLKM